MTGERACPSCATPLASGQRYCLGCGHAVSSALPALRAAVTWGAPVGPSPRPRRRAQPTARAAGAFTAMLAAGLGVGVIAGALFTPPSPVQAAQLIAVRVPVARAAATTSPGHRLGGEQPLADPAPRAASPAGAGPRHLEHHDDEHNDLHADHVVVDHVVLDHDHVEQHHDLIEQHNHELELDHPRAGDDDGPAAGDQARLVRDARR